MFTAAIILAVLLGLSLTALIVFTLLQNRAIRLARPQVQAALAAGPAPPLEVVDRIAAQTGEVVNHLAVAAALRDLEADGLVVSEQDRGPLPAACMGRPRRIYRIAGR